MAKWLILINAADNLLGDCEKTEAVTTIQTTHSPQEPINVDCELATVGVAGDVMEQVNLINDQFQAGVPNNLERKEKERVNALDAKRKLKGSIDVFNKKDMYLKKINSLSEAGVNCCPSDFQWTNEKINCIVCSGKPISHYKHIEQHVETKIHERNKAKLELLGTASSQIKMQARLVHTVIRYDEKVYRMETLKVKAKAQLSMNCLEEMRSWIDLYSKPGCSIGNPRDVVRNYAKPLRQVLMNEMKDIFFKCHPEYSISLDGTPSFAEAECIIIRIVTKHLQILELVVRIALFKEKIYANELSNHILKTISVTMGLCLKDWVAVQLDRTSTNKAAITRIKSIYVDAKPTSNYCASHGLNNCGKRFFDSARYAETFIKLWQPVVMFSGYARSLAASKFNEEVKTSGGIRFLAKLEQSFQIFKAGLKTKNIDEIIPF